MSGRDSIFLVIDPFSSACLMPQKYFILFNSILAILWDNCIYFKIPFYFFYRFISYILQFVFLPQWSFQSVQLINYASYVLDAEQK